MAILSLDEMNNAVDEVYGKKPKTAQDIIATKKSSMTTFNPTQPMADAVTQTSSTPEIYHPLDLHKAVLDTYAEPPPPEPRGRVTGFLGDVGKGLASLADVAYSPVPAVLGGATQAIVRPFTNPQEAEKIGGNVSGFLEKPVGKFFGVTEDPAYKQELSNKISQVIGEYGNKGADFISKKTGLPVEDVRNMLNTASFAIPEVGGELKPVAKAITKPIVEEAKLISGAIGQKVPKVRIELQKQLEQKKVPEITQNLQQLEQDFQQKKANPEQVQPIEQVVQENNAPPVAQDLGTAKPATPDADFKEVHYGESGLPLDEQYARAKVAQKVLGEDHQADLSAIEGRGKERSTNFQTSKTDTALGNYLSERFADEQNRLNAYQSKLVKDTGGTEGLDESAVYKRGNTILEPLKGLEDYFDKKTEGIYKARDEQGKSIPVIANKINETLNDRTLSEISDPAERLAKTSKIKLEQLGMMDKDGNLLPTDAYHSELFRKWLNQNYDPKANQLHKALKGAVDDDVLANMDTNSPLYKDARQLVELRKNTLDNPKGISNILEANGPKDINRKVDVEKIPQNITNMPVDQFTHVIDTLKSMPDELQPQAQKALGEVKAHFVNQMADKTPAQLTKFLNGNKEVMGRLFSPQEMENIRDFHNAKHIFKTDTGYPGAAAQTINIEKKLGQKIGEMAINKGIPLGAELVTGGHGMGVPALVTSHYLEKRTARKNAEAQATTEKQAFENAQSRFIPIKDLLKP